MNRHCILIGAPGSKVQGNYLNGVSKDMHKMKSFLTSNYGGAWKDSEITSIVNPEKSALLQLFREHMGADFQFVLFSGHGGISTIDSEMYVEINTNGDEVRVSTLYNNVDKEVIVLDTCRSYYTPTTERYDEMAKALKSADIDIRSRYRKVYDNLILQAERGSIILYSSSPGEASNETDDGGVFTQALIKAGLSITNSANKNIFINTAFVIAESSVKNAYKNQNPKMEGSIRRRNWFPFSIKI